MSKRVDWAISKSTKDPFRGPLSFKFSDLTITYNLAGFGKKSRLSTDIFLFKLEPEFSLYF